MTANRRDFLKVTATAGGGLALGLSSPGRILGERPRAIYRAEPPAGNPQKILILGGTNLTGPHNVRYAVERGHEVTIFTRGRKEPGLFQDSFEHVEKLVGDRADDLEALKGRTWDAVIDASGMEVEWDDRFGRAAPRLGGNVHVRLIHRSLLSLSHDRNRRGGRTGTRGSLGR